MELHKILIVDDDQFIKQYFIACLNSLGENYSFLTANNGFDAFKIAKTEVPDLITVDWEMPDIDGIALIKLLKNEAITSEIPIIMCTGIMLASEYLKEAIEAGAADYITKPIDETELTARIKSALRLSQSLKKIQSQHQDIIKKNEQLIESEKKYRQLANASFEGIVLHHGTAVIEVNDNMLALLKIDVEQLKHNSILNYIDNDSKITFLNALTADKSVCYELILRNSKGEFFSAEVLTKPFELSNQSIHVSAFKDVTYTKLQQETILQKEKQLNEQKTEIIKNELESNNKELVTNALYLLELIERNNKFIEDIEKVNEELSPKYKAVLQPIINKYKVVNAESIWKEFELRFEKVHQNFYKNLNQQYPNLTLNELKLCALLRLNMTTKEIAAITHQNLKSIDIARSRLRAKLNIERNESIIDLLSKF